MSATSTFPETETKSLTVQGYLDILINIIRSPCNFFATLQENQGMRRPTIFLCISAIFYATVSMTYFFENSLLMGFIYLINALTMPLLAAIFSFTLAGMSPGKKPNFQQVFTVYAYASGALMIISWIPALGMILEGVRAILVAIGLKKSCGMGWFKAWSIVAGTAILLLVFFWTLTPVLMEIKHLLV